MLLVRLTFWFLGFIVVYAVHTVIFEIMDEYFDMHNILFRIIFSVLSALIVIGFVFSGVAIQQNEQATVQ